MLSTSSREVPRKFRPGTRIVREWKGKVHEVTITDGGFEYTAQIVSQRVIDEARVMRHF